MKHGREQVLTFDSVRSEVASTDATFFILRAVEIEVWLRRAGDVNPLMVGLTKNQGTHVPRSPQFSPRLV
jgi:hypothetical protein